MVSVIAFLISGLGLVALILAILALCNKSRGLAIAAIVIGAICIVVAIIFWIILIVMLVRKAALESTYCPVLTTACCSGTYINSIYGYNLFTCQPSSNTCSANPLTYSVSATCSGSYSQTLFGVSCTGTSSCNGVAYDLYSSVCSSCSQSISCAANQATGAGTYCKWSHLKMWKIFKNYAETYVETLTRKTVSISHSDDIWKNVFHLFLWSITYSSIHNQIHNSGSLGRSYGYGWAEGSHF